VLKRRKQIAPLLKGFAADGDLVICDAQPADRDRRCEATTRCRRTFARSSRSSKVKESGLLPENAAIGLDAAMATDLVDALDAAGFVA
jgi:hypothetical protein